jgi:uncharacterized lipoprotein YmbA
MIHRILPHLLVSFLITLTVFSGCSQRKAYDKHYYFLSSIRKAQPITRQKDFILEVSNFTIDSPFGGKGLVYRTGEMKYETDFYNEFLVSPRSMITEKTRNWLAASGLSQRILNPGSQINPTHMIEGNITALYGDFREETSPKAILEIRIFLLETKAGEEPVSVFGETYKSSIALETNEAESLVNALDKCLKEVLTSLEKDLSGKLS